MPVPAISIPSGVGSSDPDQEPLISWQPGWQELDLITGLVVEANGTQTLLDPAAFATAPRDGIQLADVQVRGSDGSDRIFVGVGSSADGGAGDDDLFNTESLGGNWLVGGIGADRFFLRQAKDLVVGGSLITGSRGLAPGSALVDGDADQFLIDSSESNTSADLLQINDFEVNRDVALIDGVLTQGSWEEIKQALAAAGVAANAAPQLLPAGNKPRITLLPGVQGFQSFATVGMDPDNDLLQLVVLEGPDWLTSFDTTLYFTPPAQLTAADLAGLDIILGLYDGKAVTPFVPELELGNSIVTGFADDSVSGGDGAVIAGTEGNDILFGGDGNDTIHGGNGDDVIRGGNGDDVIRGGRGNDLINGNKGNDICFGDQGDDTLRGGQGNDTLNGGLGNDVLNGNLGNDVLTGGGGSDRFLLSKGSDTITDFSFTDGDKIVIDIDPNIDPQLQYQLIQEGSNLLIVRSQGTTTLLNVSLNAFEATNAIDFI